MEQSGKVKLRVRFGTDGKKAQWTKTPHIQLEVGCIGELNKTLKALIAATSGDKPKRCGWPCTLTQSPLALLAAWRAILNCYTITPRTTPAS